MNNTNRALNRTGIFLFGLVLIIVGGGVALAAAIPTLLSAWRTGAKDVASTATGTIRDTMLGSTGQSWIVLVIAIVALVLVVLLLIFVFRQGHGHTGTLVTKKDADVGSVVVSSAIAERAIAAALDEYTGIATSSVSTYRVTGTPTLKIAVSARRGVSPTDIREYVEQIVERFDEVLGEETPVFLKINGGFASRRAKAARLPEQATV